ncbi:MAG: hypothetical protein M5U01_20055 [Ardenticatenaceae bacterium]|nr:hypothetical protein [Ardenticatenaceae bacterium]HBY93931.1 hypothetical protein [Chloroflexota bacterium]
MTDPQPSPPRRQWRLPNGCLVLLLWVYVSLIAIALIGSQPARGLLVAVLGGIAVGLLAVKPYLQAPNSPPPPDPPPPTEKKEA